MVPERRMLEVGVRSVLEVRPGARPWPEPLPWGEVER